MRPAVLAAALALLAGCNGPSPVPPYVTPTTSRVISDVVGDAPASYDIVGADLFELNGSLALRVQVVNFVDALPLLDARMVSNVGEHYARLLFDPQKPTQPKARAEDGRIDDGKHVDGAPGCWFPSFPTDPSSKEPSWILLEFPHNRTGLEAGGMVMTLSIDALDVEGQVRDTATSEPAFSVHGGPNPYGSCPLNAERGHLT